ncbi:MAG TPA: luciferase family protein [Candidatus Sulfotelmatobacter sp.]|nr:luciferase family protein [Candidatus Sulfotelmatobacter sp.]
MTNLEKVEQEAILWPEVSVHSHRFGGREFRFRSAEIGHVHVSGVVDIPFPRSIREALLDEGFAETHHWVPDSGWITFGVRGENDVKHALWLMRISYLRYAPKTVSDASEMFEREAKELRLSPRFKSLLKPFIPNSPKEAPTQPALA